MLVNVMNRIPAPLAGRFRAGSLPARVLAPVLELGLPKRTVDVTVRSGPAAGLRLPIDPQREKFYWTGAYELEVQRVFEDILHPGACVWDVGAHVGFFTALGARTVGPGGLVYAFEPSPTNRARLVRTVELNGLEQVQVLSHAVAGRGGFRHLYDQGSSSTWSLVTPNRGPRVDVHCVTLDELFGGGSIEIPNLIKIDAEGAEPDILRGGLRLLAEPSVSVIVELNNPALVDEARSLLPGHRFEALSKSHWLLRKAA